MRGSAAEKSAAAVGAVMVVLACFAAEQHTRAWFARTTPRVESDAEGHETIEQDALGDVIYVGESMEDPFNEPTRTNPGRGSARDRCQPVLMRILTGINRGRVAVARNVLHFKPSSNAVLRRGALVHVYCLQAHGIIQSTQILKPPIRFPTLFQTLALLLLLVVLFVRVRGVLFAGAIAVAAYMSSRLLFPQILAGRPPVAVGIVYAMIVMGMLLLMGGSFGRKAISALLGAAVGLAAALVFVLAMGAHLRLSGIATTSALFLEQVSPKGVHLDFPALVACGALVAILGVTLDLGISIASSVEQLLLAGPDLSRAEAFRAGLRMNRDIAGTMMLTLIFVWLGSNIHALMLPCGTGLTFREVLNSEAMSIELLRVVGGAIGLVVTGPATAIISASILARRRSVRHEHEARRTVGLCLLTCVEVVLCVGLAFCAIRDVKTCAAGGKGRAPMATCSTADEHYQRGATRMREGDLNEAAFFFIQALQLDPKHGLARRELARLYAQKRWFVLARREIQKALTLLPLDSDTQYVAGVIAAWLQQSDEARGYLRRAVQLNPANEQAAQALENIFGLRWKAKDK